MTPQSSNSQYCTSNNKNKNVCLWLLDQKQACGLQHTLDNPTRCVPSM